MTFAHTGDRDELYAIETTTGHLKRYRWAPAPETGGTNDWPQRLYSYPLKIESKRIPYAIGDLTGDGLADYVTAAPDAARLALFAGTADGLGAASAYPGLLKTTDLALADLDGDGKLELISVSSEERTLGVSDFADGRITFPRPLGVTGKPLAVAVGKLQASDEQQVLAYAGLPQPGGR